MKWLAKYWNRLRVTEADAERLSRSYWLQFAAGRFPEVNNAAELIRVAAQFYAWHHTGEWTAEAVTVIEGGWKRAPAE